LAGIEVTAETEVTITLSREQLTQLARAVAGAVTAALAEQHARGRSAYSVAEVAARAGVSDDSVYQAIGLGLLRVVRLGGGHVARVLPTDEALWLTGRLKADDEPAIGLSAKIVMRNRGKALVQHIMGKGRRTVRSE
jgi:hypothetical protein